MEWQHCAAGVRFALLFDGRCLTAEPGLGCGVSLAPCAAEAGETNATLQAWRLEPSDGSDGLYTVHAIAKSGVEDGKSCTDSQPDCTPWAQQGECDNNPSFMSLSCRKACGLCEPMPACSVWSQRTARAPADNDAIRLMGATRAPLLTLAPAKQPAKHMRVALPQWSGMFPGWHLLRAACPGLSHAACCLEAGTWALGPRNAHVQRALWHLCSFHDAHMFPYQEWGVECAPAASGSHSESGGEGVAQGAAAAAEARKPDDKTAAWLLSLMQDEGEAALQEPCIHMPPRPACTTSTTSAITPDPHRSRAALQRLLPYELLGVGEFEEVDAAKASFRRLSRHFHPDKNPSPHAAPIFEALRKARLGCLSRAQRPPPPMQRLP